MSSPTLSSRIHDCWLGKSIGGTLGLPAEGRMDRLHCSFYDPVPVFAPPNDDLELQLVWLHLLETLPNGALTQQHFADAWLRHLHYMWDEYGRCRWNLRRGVPLAAVGTFENSFVSGMGSPIRSEIWACLFPGDPARAVHLVTDLHRAGVSAWEAREQLLASHGHDNFTHTPLNIGLTIWALLHGEGDFEKSILLTVNGGYDTDCTAATVGATIGLALGAEAIPARWIAPIGEGVFVGSGIVGIHAPTTLRELTDRTIALIGKLETKSWADLDWSPVIPAVDLAALPGAILLRPLAGSAPVSFANGELLLAVKTAGGADWDWTPAHPGEKHFIVALARAGAKLFIDGQALVDCPPGEPYVPATHRPPAKARNAFTPVAGVHYVRIELGSRSAGQEATVRLAYANLHLCPWTARGIPHAAVLPSA